MLRAGGEQRSLALAEEYTDLQLGRFDFCQYELATDCFGADEPWSLFSPIDATLDWLIGSGWRVWANLLNECSSAASDPILVPVWRVPPSERVSARIFQVKADTTVSGGPSIFNPSAVPADAVLDTDLGEVRSADVTSTHKLRVVGGTLVPIKWVRRLDLDGEFLELHSDLQLVLLERGEHGPNVPARDLHLAPRSMIWSDATRKAFSVYGAAHMFGEQEQSLRPDD